MDRKELVAIGIDIGGTKISAAAVKDGQILSEVLSYKTPDNSEDILKTVLEAVETLKDQYAAKFVGIATAGTINIDNSKIMGNTGNLPKGYNNIDFKNIIEKKFGILTLLENDANSAAYAEFKMGSAKGHNNAVVITLGTGIGGGIIVNGNLVRGKSGGAAECGHIPITWGKKRPCTCGAWDCWEAYASGTGYAKNAQEMAKEIPVEERTGILKDKNPDILTTHDIIEGLKQNDSFARKVHDRWEELLLLGFTAYANIFDPDSIVVSGGMAKFVDFDKLEKEVNSRIVVSPVKILPAKAGNYAGIIGSASLAVEKFKK